MEQDNELIKHELELFDKRFDMLQAEIMAINSKMLLMGKRFDKLTERFETHINLDKAHKEGYLGR